MEIGSTHKGKLGEFYVLWELIKRGFELYLTVIDMGIDAMVRLKVYNVINISSLRYLTCRNWRSQVKAYRI